MLFQPLYLAGANGSGVALHPAFQGVIDAGLLAIARCSEFLHHFHIKAQGYLGLGATAQRAAMTRQWFGLHPFGIREGRGIVVRLGGGNGGGILGRSSQDGCL